MKIVFKKSFWKKYSKLNKQHRNSVDITIKDFMEDCNNSRLKNHKLKGKMKGNRAIHAGFDLCIVFKEENNYQQVTFLLVGRHENVYK